MKKPGEKTLKKMVEFVVVFLFNLILFSISMLFSDLSFRDCLLYSLFNATWMLFLLLPLLDWLWHRRLEK